MERVTKEVVAPAWEAQYSFSPVVCTQGGKIVWLAGQVGFVDDNRKPLSGDFDAQVRQTFKNMQRLMGKVGGSLNDVVSMTVFVADGRYSQRLTDLRKEFWSPERSPGYAVVGK